MTGMALRLDQWLVAQGLAPSRARAVVLVESGGVLLNGRVAAKASAPVAEGDVVEVVGADHGYVSRGALKLKALFAAVGADIQGREVVDVGASTGGFTEVCLEFGAGRVYAVDVGQGQLHPRLREDARVVVLEQTDARVLDGVVPPSVTVMVADVSFISLAKVLPPVAAALPGLEALYLLVKPQFEVGRGNIGKGGIVRDTAAREIALDEVRGVVEGLGFAVQHTMLCPLVGGDGNQEYLLFATYGCGKVRATHE